MRKRGRSTKYSTKLLIASIHGFNWWVELSATEPLRCLGNLIFGDVAVREEQREVEFCPPLLSGPGLRTHAPLMLKRATIG